jgi:triosephosphate isomerase (TIM)
MRKPIVAGNWKMNTSLDEARKLAASLRDRLDAFGNVERVLIPPFPWIVPVTEIIAGSGLTAGAQNCHTDEAGAFTGEVSAEMLASLCSHIVVGHSERRHILGESDDLVGRKVHAVLRSGASAILCVGETLEERDAGSAQETVNRQLLAGLDGIQQSDFSRIVIAYEPVWAIGTGKAASADDAQEMAHAIRTSLASRFGQSVADAARIQYGGSVKADNAETFMKCPDVDGALVGGASLNPDEFTAIVRAASIDQN